MNSAGLFGLFSVIISSLIRNTETGGISRFIVGGNEAADGTYPWQLSFQRHVFGRWSHTCGASLIADRWALTASHCIYNRTAKGPGGTFQSYRISDMRLVAGATRLDPLEPDARIHYLEQVITPYGLSIYFDMALLQLKEAADTNRSDITPILIANESEPNTTGNCMITGWGTVNRNVERFNPFLKEAKTDLLTFEQCRQTGWDVAPTHVCANGAPKGVTGCYGDSGGPLTCYRDDGTPVLMGTSSFVYGRCGTKRPNVFAKASLYRRWLRRLTQIDDL